jgi:hypothetical protein
MLSSSVLNMTRFRTISDILVGPSYNLFPGSQSYDTVWQVLDNVILPPSLVGLAYKALCITFSIVCTRCAVPLAPLIIAENDGFHFKRTTDDAIFKGIIDEEGSAELFTQHRFRFFHWSWQTLRVDVRECVCVVDGLKDACTQM